MPRRYTAKIYVDDDIIEQKSGDDLDELYSWMMVKGQGKFGNLSGEITDDESGKVVKSFRKAPPD